jgi:hypothetical protein
MRLKKGENRHRVNADLKIEFTRQDVTSYAGLELFRRYFQLIRLNERVRKRFAHTGIKGDYSIIQFIMLFVCLWLTGGSRLRHVKFLEGDPLVKRLTGLTSLPSDRSLSRWLKQFCSDSLQVLVELNNEIVMEQIEALSLKSVTLDFDGTITSCGNTVEYAERGYNPHKRYSKSYYPLLCHIGETGHMFECHNRSGNCHDSKGGAMDFIESCLSKAQIFFKKSRIQIRCDAAFFTREMVELIRRNDAVDYAIKVPFWHRCGFKDLVNARQRWKKLDERTSFFEKEVFMEKWDQTVRIVFYRIKLSDKKGKSPLQLGLFDPKDGIYEYQMIYSNKEADKALEFYNGRSQMERNIAELKQEYAFEKVPTNKWHANSAFQHLSLLAYNLVRNFCLEALPLEKNKAGVSSTTLFQIPTLKTIRFEAIAAAAKVLNVDGYKILRVNRNVQREDFFEKAINGFENIKQAA